MKRIHNFYAGPAALPLEVIKEAQEELLDFKGSGVSVMETSHRSAEFDEVHNETIALFKELIGMGDDFTVMFLGGGASLQFAMIPMNFLGEGESADFIMTGTWAKKAHKEANIIAKGRIAGSSETDGVYPYIPKQVDLDLDPNAVYVHLTSNNTIAGTQYHTFPDTGDVPIVCDMSSDALSRVIDVSKFGIIFAGAQKNLGPAGVTIVAMRSDMLEKCRDGLPTMLSYKTHASKNSLFNTPPCFPIYMVNKVLHWLKKRGGVEAMQKENEEKGKLLYGTIDDSDGFYRNPIEPGSRSFMNYVFRLTSEDLEKQFVAEALEAGFIGLKGHRSVGGIRVSAYNANGLDSIKDVVAFMNDFKAKNG